MHAFGSGTLDPHTQRRLVVEPRERKKERERERVCIREKARAEDRERQRDLLLLPSSSCVYS
jgi:hypothetical protein